MNYTFITDFHKSRKNKIGASDVPWLIPHPVKQIESLAAYTDDKGGRHANTANDLYLKKINNEKSVSGFPAEMGHFIEGRALYEFIKDNISYDIAKEFFRGYQTYKIDRDNSNNLHPGSYNSTPFKHHTEAVTDFGVAHADCVYDPIKLYNPINMKKNKDGHWIIDLNGIEINMSKPFLIEAKSARYFSARRKDDPYTGYDLSLKEWQGVPLKVYFQCQFQMLLYRVDVCYLVLIYDTSSKHYWTIKANKKHQKELQQLAEYMKKCLDTKTPPKELLMNSKDIRSLFPEIQDDFRELKAKEKKIVLQYALDGIEAARQESIWKKRKLECNERMSIHLRDTKVLKANVGGHLIDVANWKQTGGAFRIMGLSDIRKREDGKTIENYLNKKGLIKQDKESEKSNICLKSKDIKNINIEAVVKDESI